jgi:SPP1 gp7 family putative phage head morphogenesis protein
MKSNLRKTLTRMRDPSLAGNLRVTYAKDLEQLFANFKTGMHQVLGVREMADPGVIGVKITKAQVSHTIEATITIPGKRITKVNVNKGYTAGAIRGTQFINAVGVKTTYGQTPADQNVIGVLEDRNLSALDGISDAMSKDIMSKMTDGVLKGEGIEKIARDIDESVDGIGRDRARLMARTETMYAFNTAARMQYDKIGVTEVEWYTSHLENVCDECDSLDGQKFSIDDAPPIPLHPNCPCILLPVIDIEAFRGVRG